MGAFDRDYFGEDRRQVAKPPMPPVTKTLLINPHFPATPISPPPVRPIGSFRGLPSESKLLAAHRVPWDHQMRNGRPLWNELSLRYQRGVDWMRSARKQWDSLAGKVDSERHSAVAAKLAIQEKDAVRWRDACLLYFQTFSKLPFPAAVDKPTHTLEEVMANDPIKAR